MTFTEAALEVLRSAGEPLHYKKITELAIERNLLSHVGKTPEVTMSSRLAMMVKKDRGQAPIIKVKPGVFAIRESALDGQSLSAEALAAIHEVEGVDESVATALDGAAAVDEVKAPSQPLPGGDVFPEEEGDDDPILAGLEQETESTDRSGRRRRRRRRRGKGDKPEGANDVVARPESAVREPVREPERAREPARQREPSGRERESTRRDSGRDRGPNRDSTRDANRDSNRDANRDLNRERDSGRRDAYREPNREQLRAEEPALDYNRQPADGDLLGKDLADAIWLVLSRGDRVPHTFSRVAELLVRRGRLSGSPMALAPTIGAAARADMARAELTRTRPRFRVRGSQMALSEWSLPKSLLRAEQDLGSAAERHSNELRRALIQKLSDLPTAGFAELVATWLNTEGVIALRAVRRPGSSGSELHFAGTRKSGSEEVRLAIVVQRGGRDIDREAVIDVRGALHHYGQATSAWIVTTGRVTSGAREEAAMPAAAATALFDGMALASAMERLGIAVRRHVIAHHELDYDLLEALGDTPEQRERREREQERERREFTQQRNDNRSDRQVAAHASHESSEDGAPELQPLRGLGQARKSSDEAVDDNARTLIPMKVIPASSEWDDSSDEEDVDEEALDGEEALGPEESADEESEGASELTGEVRDDVPDEDGGDDDDEADEDDDDESDEDIESDDADIEPDADDEETDDDESDDEGESDEADEPIEDEAPERKRS